MQKIWHYRKWPKVLCESIFMPIYKNISPTDCNNYRTSKILLRIINKRLKTFLLPEISDKQTDFMPGRGTREQILNDRQIVEKVRGYNYK